MSLAANREAFEYLAAAAAELERRGDPGEAAHLVAMAGHVAARCHPGVFASAPLEDLAVRLDVNGPRSPSAQRTPRGVKRVLHVLTVALPLGGHTRLAERWIAGDRERVHSVAVTGPMSALPPTLDALAKRSGGWRGSVHRGPDLLASAGALRAIASDQDAVILHVHWGDCVPLLAFGRDGAGPPVALVDHADHQFWLGQRAADLVIHLRESGRRLGAQRRGIGPDGSTLFGIPLHGVKRRRRRDRAKSGLGIPEDAVLLVTMAADYKYGEGGRPFVDLVLPVLRAQPATRLVVIGPSGGPAWADATEGTNGRVQTVGPIVDPGRWLDAADIYLDSFPFCSNTSLLETVLRDTPAVAYQPADRRGTVLAADAPGLDSLPRPGQHDEYRDTLERLVGDVATRTRVGEELGVAVRRAHAGARWLADLDATYALMTERTGARARATPAAPGASERLDDLLVEIGPGVREGIDAVSSWYVQRWPRRVPRIPVLVPDPPRTTWGSATAVDVVESVIAGAARASETLLRSAEQTLGARVARRWARWLGRRRLSRRSP